MLLVFLAMTLLLSYCIVYICIVSVLLPLSLEVVLIKFGVTATFGHRLLFTLACPPVSLFSLLNNHINLSSLTPCFRSFFRSYYQTVFILRPVRMVTPSIWSTSYSTERILPPRMPLETLPCTSVLYTTRYFTEYKSSIAFPRLYRNLMQWSLKLCF